jgi:3-hydroxybutyryl-CoA dehydrogenase
MNIGDIKKVVVVGAGTMGQQISAQCAIHGFDVVVVDTGQDILDNALQRAQEVLDSFAVSGKISRAEADTALNRITGTVNLQEAAADADLINESVPEDPDLKKTVFSQLHALCPEHTIFTTNTSTLAPSSFAESTGRPQKFMALHFHDVRATNIVDVMAHPGTSEETFTIVYEFAIKIGQIPIVLKKEHPGYVFNTMLTALFDAAQTLAANDVASIEEIDRAWMGVMHMPAGPFGLMDSIGIETVWKVADHWAGKSNDEQAQKNARFLKSYVDKGHLGRKSGKGFYSYPKPAFRDPGFITKKMNEKSR